MATRLGPNQYGKAETHLVRVYRDEGVRSVTVTTDNAEDFFS